MMGATATVAVGKETTTTAKAYDYVDDDRLAGLPLALRQRMRAVQQSRMDAGHTAKNGVTYRTVERREWVDDLVDWQRSGRSPEGRVALEVRERQLRADGMF